jgi:ubiquitin-like domain-containing CTD phosphatase 1
MRIGVFPFSLLSYANIYPYPSEYAKLGMENIAPWLEEEDLKVDFPKLAVFAGHDTTIMPLLASLGPELWNDTDWAPYASMLVIEVRSMYGHCVPTAPLLL